MEFAQKNADIVSIVRTLSWQFLLLGLDVDVLRNFNQNYRKTYNWETPQSLNEVKDSLIFSDYIHNWRL